MSLENQNNFRFSNIYSLQNLDPMLSEKSKLKLISTYSYREPKWCHTELHREETPDSVVLRVLSHHQYPASIKPPG